MAVILVTGAAGFIGSHVTERLLGRGDTVVGFDNFDPFYPRAAKERNLAEARRHPAFVFIEGDLRDPATVAGVLEQHRPDRIVHLAAKAGVRPSIDDPVAYVETNITGTLNLLCACRRFPVEHFVFASSSSVYGEAEKVPFSETDATDSPASPYAATKKAGETLCFTYHRLLRMPVTCLRFFNVFGPRQRPDLAVSKFVPLIDAGKPVPFFGDGSTSRDYTFVGDTLEGIVAALDHPSGYEVYNLGRSNPVSLREMVEGIERVLGKKAVIDPLPEQAVDVRITFADVTRARERLGYEPRVGFEEGVRRYVAWWRDSGG